MIAMPQHHRAKLLDSIRQLAKGCPVDQSNPADCPLFAIRQLNRTQRMKLFHTLTDDDLSYLASYHCICMEIKLRAHKPKACAGNSILPQLPQRRRRSNQSGGRRQGGGGGEPR